MADQMGVIEPSTGQIFRQIAHDVQDMIQAEIRLVKTELRETSQRVGKAGGMFAGAAVAGLFGLACFVVFVIALLLMVVPLWLASLIVAVVLSAAAAAMFFAGRTKMRETPVLPETTRSVKETKEWLKHRAS